MSSRLKFPSRLSAMGWAAFVTVVLIAFLRALVTPGPPQPRRLTELEKLEVGNRAAGEEPKWRRDSKKSFPQDLWSQDDDFANSERRWVRGEANRRNVSETDIWQAIDSELRSGPLEAPRRATSAPAKPRPFYD